MQVSSVLTVTTSLLAGIAQADDCVDGLIYCGQTLLNTLGKQNSSWKPSIPAGPTQIRKKRKKRKKKKSIFVSTTCAKGCSPGLNT